MRIWLHIGLEQVGANRLQEVLADKREQLLAKGVLFARSVGAKNHTRLFMAVSDPAHVDQLRFNRGYAPAERQRVLHDAVAEGLAREVQTHRPDVLILSCSQLGAALSHPGEVQRLHALLAPLSDDIRILAHVDEPARLLARRYAAQVLEGRAAPLSRDLALVGADWWQAALDTRPLIDPRAGRFAEVQAAPFWLDYAALVEHWEAVFGPGSVDLRAYDEARFFGAEATEELRAAFGLAFTIGKAEPGRPPQDPSAAWLARARQLNEMLLRLLDRTPLVLPRKLWSKLLSEIRVDGPPIDPAGLAAVSKGFAAANRKLAKAHEGLPPDLFRAPRARVAWTEADPTMGFRATQYLLAFRSRIEKASREAGADMTQPETSPRASDNAGPAALNGAAAPADGLSDAARAIMPPLAQQNHARLLGSPFRPHNRMGAVDEEQLAAAYTPVPPRDLPPGNSGNVIVGCMKNEAPYIVEWVAYHRAIGVDNFLIYTNDCSDGTSEILDRLQQMGVLEHRNNDKWKGNSPQQYALNQAQKEPVLKQAEWIAHIDVDEFINVRCGNGTLADFFARVPGATNVAMTWRLFGHNNVAGLSDEFVIDQFDTCAPSFCPKPHTVWGFKTMFANIGAYKKISCHRPNKLNDGFEDRVKWVNGSGQDMTREARDKGWRNSVKSIGYDLVQLNHYALRSAESFLIKRQRGRALHVDRSIGLNYWIRMDWCDVRDVTIKRNLPRLRAEYDRLMQDKTLRRWHDAGRDWHRAKADELHAMPEFRDLYQQALSLKLSETERVAYALALDMET